MGGVLIWYVPRPHSVLAAYLRKVPKSSLWLTLATNSLIIWMGYKIFVSTNLLFDAASFFLIISAVMGSLVSTLLVQMDTLKRAPEDTRHEAAVHEARSAGERATLAGLNGQALAPIHSPLISENDT